MDILTSLPPRRPAAARWLVVALLALGGNLGFAATSLETAVKAAYLSKFGLYTSWPDSAFADNSAKLCLLGDDPFGAQLEQNLANQRIQDRPVQIRRLSAPEQATGCHILFINEPDPQRRGQILDNLRNSKALTVTDTRSGAATGIINFVIKDNRVRFDIDDAAAAQAGLAISSKLLRLALTVKPRP